MDDVRLTYFASHGRGLGLRLLFHLGGVPFDDERVDRAEWDRRKPSTPYGTLPVLTHDGVMLGDTCAITWYVARHTGHWPEDPVAQARALGLLNRVDEVWTALAQVVEIRNPVVVAWRVVAMLWWRLDEIVGTFERQFDGACLLGDRPMAPDIALYAVLTVARRRAGRWGVERILAGHPRVLGLLNHLDADPRVRRVVDEW